MQVTELLEKVDENVMKATDSAAAMVASVRAFASHTQSVHSSVQMWVDFFQAFEEQEKRRLHDVAQVAAEQAEEARREPITAESVVSPRPCGSPIVTCGSPEASSGKDVGLKRRRCTPEHTPEFSSPPRSIHAKLTTHSRTGGTHSPVPSPKLGGAVRVGSLQFQDQAASNAGLTGTWSAADQSLNDSMQTPELSSPTATVTITASAKKSMTRAIAPASSRGATSAPLSDDILQNLPPIFRAGDGAKQMQGVYATVMRHDTKGITQAEVAAALSFDLPRIRFLLDTLVAKKLLRLVDGLDDVSASTDVEIAEARYHVVRTAAKENIQQW